MRLGASFIVCVRVYLRILTTDITVPADPYMTYLLAAPFLDVCLGDSSEPDDLVEVFALVAQGDDLQLHTPPA
jgi:hypothetical protein